MEPIFLQKNKTDMLIIQEKEYKGRQYVDFRIWYSADNSSAEPIPTKKGFVLTVEKYEELKKLILKGEQNEI